jgi:hypothetical protein
MTSMSDYRTWTTVHVMPPKPAAKEGPSFEEQMLAADLKADADQCNRKLAKNGDQVTCKFNSDKAVVAARRLEWLAMLPDGEFTRVMAAEVWEVTEGAGDSRIEVLEREGKIKRVAVKPLRLVKL